MAKKVTKKVKKVKKRWVNVVAPVEFSSVDLGASYCVEPEDLIGRKMKVNLMHLTREMKKQNTRITFELNEIKDGKAQTKVCAYEIIPAHVKKITRRGKAKVSDAFECVTKDKVKLVVKPLVITRGQASKAKMSDLRAKTKEILCNLISGRTYSAVVKGVLSFEIQKVLSSELKKVTPVNISLIRKFSIVNE